MARLDCWSMYISEIQSSEFGVITLLLNLWFTWFLKLVRWLFACLSEPAQRRKGAFCQQLCQRTPRQLLSLELDLLEIGENVRCPVPLGFRAKPT